MIFREIPVILSGELWRLLTGMLLTVGKNCPAAPEKSVQ